jgi:hypothetical protein
MGEKRESRGQFKDRLDLHRDVVGYPAKINDPRQVSQTCLGFSQPYFNSNTAPISIRVLPRVGSPRPHGHEQLAAPIDHEGMAGKIGGGVHHARTSITEPLFQGW